MNAHLPTLRSISIALSMVALTAHATDSERPAGWVQDACADPAVFVDYTVPDPDAPALGLDNAWPTRVAPAGHPRAWFAHATKVPGPLLKPRDRWTDKAPADAEDPLDREDARTLATVLGLAEPDTLAPRENNGLRISLQPVPRGRPVPRRDVSDAAFAIRVLSAMPQSTDDDTARWSIDSTAFLVLDPSEPAHDATDTKGLIVLMPGLFGTPEGPLQGLARSLRNSGWTVLRMVAQPSRFTESANLAIRTTHPQEDAQRVADHISQRLADCAYSVEAACDLLESERPHLASLPRLAIGYSAGAISLPTVVALERERYAGCVLVGGGAPFYQMIDTSTYTSMILGDAIAWDTDAPPKSEARHAAYAAYLAHAPLDSYHTAPLLKDMPSLTILGSQDQAVPSPLGDILWHRMGRKDREHYPVGHEMLFARLTTRFAAITAWCDALAPEPEPKPAPEPAP